MEESDIKIIENEDGSVDLSIMLSEEEKDALAQKGLKYALVESIYKVTMEDIMKILGNMQDEYVNV